MVAVLLATLLCVDPSVELERGRALAASGDLRRASEQLRRVAAAYPTWGLAQLELAEVLLKAGGGDAALEKTLAAARSLDPLNPRAWMLSGRLHQGRGEAAKAVDEYSRAAQLRPDLVEPHERLGALFSDAGRFAEAAAQLKLVVAARADDRTARANLAEVCERAGDLPAAEHYLKALVEVAPKNVAYRRRLIEFYERTGQADKAAHAQRAEAARPARHLRPLR